jgi:hypothetical protein
MYVCINIEKIGLGYILGDFFTLIWSLWAWSENSVKRKRAPLKKKKY